MTLSFNIITGGYIEYIFNGQTIPNTREVFATVSLAQPKAFLLNPTFSTYYDFGNADGFYLVAGLNHSFVLNQRASVVIDSALGYGTANYNKWYFGVDNNRLNDWSSGLTWNYAISSKFTFSCGVRYGIMVNEEIRQGAFDIFGAFVIWW